MPQIKKDRSKPISVPDDARYLTVEEAAIAVSSANRCCSYSQGRYAGIEGRAILPDPEAIFSREGD